MFTFIPSVPLNRHKYVINRNSSDSSFTGAGLSGVIDQGRCWVPHQQHAPSYHVTVVTNRMRNAGGFSNPPRLPASEAGIQRAIILLGNFTQRRMKKASTLTELESLVGRVPKTRLEAQQWKVRLQRRNRPPKPAPKLLAELPLPRERNDVARLFILLQVVRKKLSVGRDVSPVLQHKISKRLVGMPCPTTTNEVRLYIRTLAHYEWLRKRAERRPPVLPVHDLDRLRQADQLLGAYAGNGAIGKQIHTLIDLVGSYPQTKNMARSWQKIVQGAIRRKHRKDRVFAKWIVDDQKRLQRRLKRMQRMEGEWAIMGQIQQEQVVAALPPVLRHVNGQGDEGEESGQNSIVSDSAQVSSSRVVDIVTCEEGGSERRNGFMFRLSSIISWILDPSK